MGKLAEVSRVYVIMPNGIGRKVRVRASGKVRFTWHKDPFHPVCPGEMSCTYYGRLELVDSEEHPHFVFNDPRHPDIHDRFMKFYKPKYNVYPETSVFAREERTHDYLTGKYDPKKYLKGAKSVKELL